MSALFHPKARSAAIARIKAEARRITPRVLAEMMRHQSFGVTSHTGGMQPSSSEDVMRKPKHTLTARLNAYGYTVEMLQIVLGLSGREMRVQLFEHPFQPRNNAAIAALLDTTVQALWPDWFDEAGAVRGDLTPPWNGAWGEPLDCMRLVARLDALGFDDVPVMRPEPFWDDDRLPPRISETGAPLISKRRIALAKRGQRP
jgi:lambda repressor-like predicted transcriptional regulator